MNRTATRLFLWVILLCTAPTIYFIFVAAGVLPTIFYLFFTIGDPALIILWGVHLVIYSAILYLTALFLTKLLFGIQSNAIRHTLLGTLVILLCCGSLLPVYVIGGHGSSYNTNIIGAFKDAGRISYMPW